MKRTIFNIIGRHCLVVLLLICGSTQAIAEEGVILSLKNGQTVIFAFNDKPQIVLGKDLTITTTDEISVNYEYREIRSIRFGDPKATGIEETTSDKSSAVSFKIVNSTLYVYGLPLNEQISIYTLGGRKVSSQKQTGNGSVLSIPLTSQGVLVVRTSTGISYKLLNP